jgi:signal transduction histidine kinase
MGPSRKTLADELRAVPTFSDLDPDAIEWLASHMKVVDAAPGDVVTREGSPADRMIVMLEGELRGRREAEGGDDRVVTMRAGQVSGMLPYSRLTEFPLTVRAVDAAHFAEFPKDLFSEMLVRIPVLGKRLVAVMSDRIRETARSQEQRQKLAALGKLSAGLAHELNNPAAAVRRAAGNMREAIEALRAANRRLDEFGFAAAQRECLARLDRQLEARPSEEDALERSDREDALAAWLERRSVPNFRDLAGSLADAGIGTSALDEIDGCFPGPLLAAVVTRLSAALVAGRLVEEIENSAGRISELVRAIKEYSYMDQAPVQEIDLHDGIESTLVMLRHQLKQGVTVVREFDRTLPRICARGSELNQVWTNLIDNAIDAMGGKGELRIRTARELDRALVEIRDNGPGIPPELRDRIFEPFFTTKNVGDGIGLGLDAVYRIVNDHHGEIRVDSRPGDTRFRVLLPFGHS